MNDYFDKLEIILKEHNFLLKPERIYTVIEMSEKGSMTNAIFLK